MFLLAVLNSLKSSQDFPELFLIGQVVFSEGRLDDEEDNESGDIFAVPKQSSQSATPGDDFFFDLKLTHSKTITLGSLNRFHNPRKCFLKSAEIIPLPGPA